MLMAGGFFHLIGAVNLAQPPLLNQAQLFEEP
jgi:hypothetical protein